MQVNPNIFREYDIRGEVDKDLSPELAHMLGCAFATYAFHQGIKSLVVGRDMRLSSPAYHDAVIAGLLESGADVLDIALHRTVSGAQRVEKRPHRRRVGRHHL